ncbi:POK18 protein, partial [Corythaixoides concolor]|nr:POK18 protein [Corythaixoides concolor]
DGPKFAFSIPSINQSEPMKRYHWVVLSQGIKNSPAICQIYVARAPSGIRLKYPQMLIYHYMDDILLASQSTDLLARLLQKRFKRSNLGNILGWKISMSTVRPQRITLHTKIHTLNDLQRLLGTINWVRPMLGIDNTQLSPLLDMLKGEPCLNSLQQLTPEVQKALAQVELAIQSRQAYRQKENLEITLMAINNHSGMRNNRMILLEWVFLSHQQTKTIVSRTEMIAMVICKSRKRIVQMQGREPACIRIPLTQEQLEWCLANSVALQNAFLGFAGQVSIHYPSHKMLSALQDLPLQFRPRCRPTPVEGITVFTDGS